MHAVFAARLFGSLICSRGVPHRDADAIASRENQARYLLGVREAFDERSILPLESNDSAAIEKNAVFIAQDLDW